MQPLRIRHHERPVGSCRKGRLGGICEVNSLVGKTLDNVQANGVPDVENLVQILALDIEYQLEIERAWRECVKSATDKLGALGLDNFF